MKIKGREIRGVNIETIILPRGNGEEDLVFKAQAILDIAEFEKLCPIPKAPKKTLKGGIVIDNIEDSVYKESLNLFAQKKMAWMVIKSLEATEGLEWETIKLDDSDTWLKYPEEFKNSGLCETEVARIINGVFTANALNESKIEEARNRFLSIPPQTPAVP